MIAAVVTAESQMIATFVIDTRHNDQMPLSPPTMHLSQTSPTTSRPWPFLVAPAGGLSLPRAQKSAKYL